MTALKSRPCLRPILIDFHNSLGSLISADVLTVAVEPVDGVDASADWRCAESTSAGPHAQGACCRPSPLFIWLHCILKHCIIIIIIITDIYMARIRKMQQKRQVNCYSLQLLS